MNIVNARWKKVAKAVARARKRLDLSQVELAEQCDVSAATVAGWETGRHGIRAANVSRVADVLKVEIAELVA